MGDAKKIHVGLYGDGSRNARLREEIVFCVDAEKCSLYCEGKCLKITSPFAAYCPLGMLQMIDGGTKRSKAFTRVTAEARSDECYGKLRRAYNTYFAVAGDWVIIGGMSVKLNYSDTLSVESPGFTTNYVAIPKSEFTVDIIKKIYDARPRAFMGGEITSFTKDQLPFFFLQMKKTWREKYEEFAEAVPQVRDLVPNYVGKWAKVSTLNRNVPVDGFEFEGDYLVGEYTSGFLPFSARSAYIRIPITDELKVKIKDNNQVTEDTVFV